MLDGISSWLMGHWQNPQSGALTYIKSFYESVQNGSTLPDTWWNALVDATTNIPQMVADGIAYSLAGVMYFLPPGGNFPTIFHSAFIYMGNAMQNWSFILPVSDVMYCLSLIIEVKLALWVFHIVRNGIYFVRGINNHNYKTTINYY